MLHVNKTKFWVLIGALVLSESNINSGETTDIKKNDPRMQLSSLGFIPKKNTDKSSYKNHSQNYFWNYVLERSIYSETYWNQTTFLTHWLCFIRFIPKWPVAPVTATVFLTSMFLFVFDSIWLSGLADECAFEKWFGIGGGLFGWIFDLIAAHGGAHPGRANERHAMK